MKKKRFTEELIIAVLKEHETGMKTGDLARKRGISEATLYDWKAKFGGMDVSDAKRQRALEEEEYDKLKRLLAETINGLYEAEVIHRRGPWRSFKAVEFATLEWVDWSNKGRLLEPIGNIPPAEAKANYFAATAAMDNIPMAA